MACNKTLSHHAELYALHKIETVPPILQKLEMLFKLLKL